MKNRKTKKKRLQEFIVFSIDCKLSKCYETKLGVIPPYSEKKIMKKPRCLYYAKIADFVATPAAEIFGSICNNYHGDALTSTRDAWMEEIQILKRELSSFSNTDGKIIFEYDIPRLGKRIDVVLLLKGIIFCLEFKVGESTVLQADIEQVLDYALDLKNFHLFSQNCTIVPVLIPTKHTKNNYNLQKSVYEDSVLNPLICGFNGIAQLVNLVVNLYSSSDACSIDDNWVISPYSPTPTIVEAAKALYENHSVEDITRHEADKVMTDRTISYIMNIIRRSKTNCEKNICFVTGVPGAGKTLVGLDVAVKQSLKNGEEEVSDDGAVYLSGNGPLVAVLTEALARNNYEKCREKGEPKKKSDSRREVSKFIQIIHRYRDNMLAKIKNPVENGILEIDPQKAVKLKDTGYGEVEHVAIFDEAQRAWTHSRLANYLKRGGTYGNKLKVPNFPVSEAAFLIWSLDQREDWATIVCLVGGGQEINTGEAGISEWINALNEHFPHWNIHISNKLIEPEYAEGKVNELLSKNKNVTFSEELHLAVSLRSFRAEKLSEFVHALLSIDKEKAKSLLPEILQQYPIVLTRDMDKARRWLRSKSRGSQRTGVLVSKAAARFKPQAVHVLSQEEENTVHWFLEDIQDSRSSNYLEDAATEIQVQGLELDYTCVLWDADVRFQDGNWHFYTFNGKKDWNEQLPKTQNKRELIKYMLNAYRVLLTRARMGMVICVPNGNPNILYENDNTHQSFWEDPTRQPSFYDGTYSYFKSLGIPEI